MWGRPVDEIIVEPNVPCDFQGLSDGILRNRRADAFSFDA
jgi:hypothetical protein